MTSPTFDNSIPELTEVIVAKVVPEIVADVVKPAELTGAPGRTFPFNAVPPSPAFKANDDHAQPQPLSEWSDEKWRRLETEVRERIAKQVSGRIDFVLEQRVRDSLADVLQTAVEGLANEIKEGLQASLEEAIGRAVAQEITRMKTSKY